MKPVIKVTFEKLLVGVAALAVAASGVWVWQNQAETRRLRQQAVAAHLTGSAYEPGKLVSPETGALAWPKAPSQSSGGGWLYEVFTPPVIYYNTLAKSFTVTPPRFGSERVDTPFGLELLAVKLEPFRLQLVGYFGSTGDYQAAFVSPSTPETLIAREGKRFENLGLTLKSFDVKKVVVAHSDAWPVYDIAGLAIMQDDKTGAEVVLDSRAEKLTDTPLAVVKITSGPGEPRELHEGDTFTDETVTYRVERIQLEPAEVVIARLTPGLPAPETKVLRPAAVGGDAQLAERTDASKNFPAHPTSGLAHNGP